MQQKKQQKRDPTHHAEKDAKDHGRKLVAEDEEEDEAEGEEDEGKGHDTGAPLDTIKHDARGEHAHGRADGDGDKDKVDRVGREAVVAEKGLVVEVESGPDGHAEKAGE